MFQTARRCGFTVAFAVAIPAWMQGQDTDSLVVAFEQRVLAAVELTKADVRVTQYSPRQGGGNANKWYKTSPFPSRCPQKRRLSCEDP